MNSIFFPLPPYILLTIATSSTNSLWMIILFEHCPACLFDLNKSVHEQFSVSPYLLTKYWRSLCNRSFLSLFAFKLRPFNSSCYPNSMLMLVFLCIYWVLLFDLSASQHLCSWIFYINLYYNCLIYIFETTFYIWCIIWLACNYSLESGGHQTNYLTY